MAVNGDLHLYEEVLLLALRDRKGTFHSVHYRHAIGGAVLAELLLDGRAVVETGKNKKHYLKLVTSTPTGDPLIDACLEKIRKAKRRATLQTWVGRLSGVRDVKHLAARRLCRRGILRADEDTILLLFRRKLYPEIDPGPERAIVERMRAAIFTDAAEVDSRTAVLISIAKGADLLKTAFDRKRIKGRKAHIEKIVNGELTGKATKDAIDAMQAAIVVAAVIPSLVAAAAVHH